MPTVGPPRFITPHMDPKPMRRDALKPARRAPVLTPLELRARFEREHPNDGLRFAIPSPGSLAAMLAASLKADGNPRLGYGLRVRAIRAAIAAQALRRVPRPAVSTDGSLNPPPP